ncbi:MULTISPECIES: hypothetical protein [Asticcacaulis]|uniref:hypothetical protein n=1 Tax=Asticcacaulis TaxID=76890 RepID=UPI001AE1DFBB|nr:MULTISPECIES: hypothetical protein [Asticcacaulis]MBP2158411.1 hypothetical protein [Asticcacaulis solisilvae]MDR6799456.1 hypothetical protein [Asticcacaulis sp. BE141]
MIDEKTLFSGLQSELNSRVIARASINTAHIQTVVTFTAGYIAARASSNFDSSGYLGYIVGAIIPMVSYYFISLYRHHDMQIGLLNRTLRRIEDSSEISDMHRFFKVGGDSGAKSYKARNISNMAVIWLCFLSPVVIFLDYVILFANNGFSWPEFSNIDYIFVTWVASLTAWNFWSLLRLGKFRKDLIAS